MAFGDIILADSAAANKTFTETRRTSEGADRIDTTSTDLSVPRTLSIKHALVGNDKTLGGPSDRHLLQVVHKRRDASGNVVPLIINLSAQIPRNSVITTTDRNDALKFVTNFLAVSGNVDKWLRGES